MNIYKFKVFVDSDNNFGDIASVVIDENQEISEVKRRALTQEINTVETVFINDVAKANISIVHAQGEIDFAGVAALGTAHLLSKLNGKLLTNMITRNGIITISKENSIIWVQALPSTLPPWNFRQFDNPEIVEAIELTKTESWQHTMAWAWINEAKGTIRARTFASDWDIAEAEGNGSGAMLLATFLNKEIKIKHGKGSQIFAKPVENSYVALGGHVIEMRT